MKDFITFLLAIMIFGPSINVTDKNGKLRFTYTGVIGEIFRYIYWIIEKFAKKISSYFR